MHRRIEYMLKGTRLDMLNDNVYKWEGDMAPPGETDSFYSMFLCADHAPPNVHEINHRWCNNPRWWHTVSRSSWWFLVWPCLRGRLRYREGARVLNQLSVMRCYHARRCHHLLNALHLSVWAFDGWSYDNCGLDGCHPWLSVWMVSQLGLWPVNI